VVICALVLLIIGSTKCFLFSKFGLGAMHAKKNRSNPLSNHQIPCTCGQASSVVKQYDPVISSITRNNVYYLQLIGKLNIIGIIELFEFEFITNYGFQYPMPLTLRNRVKLWNEAILMEQNFGAKPKRLSRVAESYRSYCSDMKSRGLVPEPIGNRIVELTKNIREIYKDQKFLDNYVNVFIPFDLLSGDQVMI